MTSKATEKSLIGTIICFLILMVFQESSIADTIIYGANSYNHTDMLEINLTQGTSQKVGDIAFGTQAIEQDPETGYVYYFEWQYTGDEFSYWDPVTSTNTLVRRYDPAPSIYAKRMAFAPDGVLYLMTTADNLYTIDKITGDLSLLGQVTGLQRGDYGGTGDIAFSPDGTLYVVTYRKLYTIDIETLTPTLVYSDIIDIVAPITLFTGLAYCDGLLYATDIEAVDQNDQNAMSAMFSIDPASGDVIKLFYTQIALNDLTSCPAGSSMQNRSPVLDPIGDKSVNEGELLEFEITASDPDAGDVLSYTVEDLPVGADFNPITRMFSWTPVIGDTGNYAISFTVTDDGTPPLGDSEIINILVNPDSTTTIELKGESVTEDNAIGDRVRSLLNYGGSLDNFAIGSYGINIRSLIKWDISSIPPGSTILSAQMSLYSYRNYIGGSITIDAHRVLQPWIEGTLDHQDRLLDNPDSSCWDEYGNGQPWDQPGADGPNDRSATIISSETNSGTGWYSWDIKEAVQKWVDDEWVNNGLLLKSTNENSNNLKLFTPSEHSDEALRPALVIDYIPPGLINRPPVLDSIGDKSVNEGELLEFAITASDPDAGDVLSYTVEDLPAGADFNPATRMFNWTPAIGDAGNYAVSFTATDDGTPPLSDSEVIVITAGDVNRPPVLYSIGDKSVNEGKLLEFAITASDPDAGDVLSYTVEDLPVGADFDPITRMFSWTPVIGDTGNYAISFTVTDDGTPPLSDSEVITLTVNPAPTTTLELKGESDTEDNAIVDRIRTLLNYGGSPVNFAIGVYSIKIRSLIKWDVSSIPAGSTIVSAQMSLYSYRNYYGGSITIDAHRVLQPWVEGTLDHQDRQLDNPDSSCWDEYGNGQPWDQPGADGPNDRSATIISSETNSGTGWYSWDIKEAVQRWVDDEWVNNGLLLKLTNENSNNLKLFAPSEHSDEALRPTLVIEYVEP